MYTQSEASALRTRTSLHGPVSSVTWRRSPPAAHRWARCQGPLVGTGRINSAMDAGTAGSTLRTARTRPGAALPRGPMAPAALSVCCAEASIPLRCIWRRMLDRENGFGPTERQYCDNSIPWLRACRTCSMYRRSAAVTSSRFAFISLSLQRRTRRHREHRPLKRNADERGMRSPYP